MGLEIERKFLVHKHYLPELKEGVEIIQGYLSEIPSIRFRIINKAMFITIKEYYPEGKRFELETPEKAITSEEIVKLQELAISPPISKVRYKILDKGMSWEIDVYQGENSGLITADIELPSIDCPISFPAWIDSNKEITTDSRYSNFNLGRQPFSLWTKS
jgi:CYTH domain-containing protein